MDKKKVEIYFWPNKNSGSQSKFILRSSGGGSHSYQHLIGCPHKYIKSLYSVCSSNTDILIICLRSVQNCIYSESWEDETPPFVCSWTLSLFTLE